MKPKCSNSDPTLDVVATPEELRKQDYRTNIYEDPELPLDMQARLIGSELYARDFLLLSAKFAMFKTGDTCRDETGNLHAIFKEGLSIKLGPTPELPHIYQLKAIYKNKGGSARAHIWEMMAGPNNVESEVVIAFSPAGTPDAIMMAWKDIKNKFAVDLTTLDGSLNHPTNNVVLDENNHNESEPLMIEEELMNLTDDEEEEEAESTEKKKKKKKKKKKEGMRHKMKAYMKGLKSQYSTSEKTRAKQALKNVYSLAHRRDLLPFFPAFTHQNNININNINQNTNHNHDNQQEEGNGHNDEDNRGIYPRVHGTVLDYYDQFRRDGFLNKILEVAVNRKRITLVGYSMGAMLSLLLAYDLQSKMDTEDAIHRSVIDVMMFGCPRTGDLKFWERLHDFYNPENHRGSIVHFIHDWDPVVYFPSTTESYVDACKYYIVHLREDKKMPWAYNKILKKKPKKKESQLDETPSWPSPGPVIVPPKTGRDSETEETNQIDADRIEIFIVSRYHGYEYYSSGIKRINQKAKINVAGETLDKVQTLK
eukprot:TRINITY_DN1145_c0_g1_i1.p1 TRINITY_DN1145_c0_g1~~TRINITY_DN1145_c0_g1_i1.p1  ORF type:complete len:569 (+),score=130.87 TRINITY_DN1145_c0_g1_i1:99-1709(+)